MTPELSSARRVLERAAILAKYQDSMEQRAWATSGGYAWHQALGGLTRRKHIREK